MVLFKFYLGFIQVLFKFNKIKAGYEKKKRKYETALDLFLINCTKWAGAGSGRFFCIMA